MIVKEVKLMALIRGIRLHQYLDDWMKGADLHPKTTISNPLQTGWGAHLEQTSTKGLWSDWGIRLHINILELKAVSLALQRFKDQC